MNSFNNLEKQIYSSTREDAVSLKEYILFEKNETSKYAVFKLYNSINQALRKVRFEISQYNEKEELLETSVIEYSEKQGPCDYFIPEAKLQVSMDCKTIKYKLLYAKFETMYWENDEFQKIAISLDDYKEILRREKNLNDSKKKKPSKKRISKRACKKALKKERKLMTKLEKKILKKKGFYIERQFKVYKGRFAKFVVALFSIISLGLAFLGMRNFAAQNKDLTFEGLNYTMKYRINADNTVSIRSFEGTAIKVYIPKTFGERKVVSIEEGVFHNANMKIIEINADLEYIDSSTFRNCLNLTTVTGSGQISQLKSNTFVNCPSLKTVELTHVQYVSDNVFAVCSNITSVNFRRATLSENALSGLNRLQKLVFGDTDVINFYSLFGTSQNKIPNSLTKVSLNKAYISNTFLSGVSTNIKFVSLNAKAVIEDSAMAYFD